MGSRRVKTLFRNPNERNHREHRSKRGRTPRYKATKRRPYKRIKTWKKYTPTVKRRRRSTGDG